MTATVEHVAVRQKIRSWWTNALDGQESVNVSELARKAESVFSMDPQFAAEFVDTFLYAVLYDYGISMLSARRAVFGEDGEWIGDPSAWLEYEPLSGRHIAFERMTPEQARAAVEFREANIKTELERIEALRTVAEGGQVESNVMSLNGSVQAKEKDSEPDACVACRVSRSSFYEPDDEWFGSWVCAKCQQEYPESLLKAMVDSSYSYELGLRTGEVVEFSGCRLDGTYVHLLEPLGISDDGVKRLPVYSRGLDVRVDDIVWCRDGES